MAILSARVEKYVYAEVTKWLLDKYPEINLDFKEQEIERIAEHILVCAEMDNYNMEQLNKAIRRETGHNDSGCITMNLEELERRSNECHAERKRRAALLGEPRY